ncbi:hypothetical protein C6366_07745 [Desulfonatronum sp. SC1]|nr:hypothetical protein C6366_07745 [Desulfonatronum sp. SC1]
MGVSVLLVEMIIETAKHNIRFYLNVFRLCTRQKFTKLLKSAKDFVCKGLILLNRIQNRPVISIAVNRNTTYDILKLILTAKDVVLAKTKVPPRDEARKGAILLQV